MDLAQESAGPHVMFGRFSHCFPVKLAFLLMLPSSPPRVAISGVYSLFDLVLKSITEYFRSENSRDVGEPVAAL